MRKHEEERMDKTSSGTGNPKKTRCLSPEPDWSELSPEFILAVGKRLESRIEVCKFRSVCKNWRTSLPLPQTPNFLNPILPLQFQNPNANPLPFTESCHNLFTLIATTAYLVQPNNDCSTSKCWILSVEERIPGKLRILYPVSRNPVSFKDPTFPNYLNLPEFRVSEIGKGYLLRVLSSPDFKEFSYSGYKVVLCLNSAEIGPFSSTTDDCTAIVLYTNGTLMGLNLRTGHWRYVHQSLVLRFKDVLWVNGVAYAVDDGGRLYVINHLTFEVVETIVDHPFGTNFRSIRLVGWSDDVYLVSVSCKKIFKLSRMQRKWKERESLGNMSVFLGFDGNFMVSTRNVFGCSGSFMIFNHRNLDAYGVDNSEFREAVKDLGIFMYCFSVTDTSRIGLAYKAISDSLWPPPIWFLQDTFPSNKDATNNLQSGLHGQWPLNCHKKTTWPPWPTALQANNQSQRNTESCNSHKKTTWSQWPTALQADHQLQKNMESCGNLKKEPWPPWPTALQADNQLQKDTESCRTVARKVKFEGVDIRSDMVLTLQKIWAKHGNIVEGSSVQSKDMLKYALKLLAKAVTILQSSSGRTLSKSQCDDVSSILMDLKHLHLRVEWLEPFVEKAVKLHQSKPIVDALKNLNKNIAKVKELKMELIEDLANLEAEEKELEEDVKLVLEKIPFPGHVDLDQCIGDGLL